MTLDKSSNDVHGATERLAQAFQRLVPLRPGRPKGGKIPSAGELAKTSSKTLEEFYAAARIERERCRLGIIGRARVALGVQQRLLVAGYPPHLVKQVLFAMLISAFVGSLR